MLPQGDVVHLVELQQGRLDVHGGVGQEREESGAVSEQVLGQARGAHTFEYDVVGLQSLEVDPAGKGRVETLGQTLAYRHSFGYDGILHMTRKHLGGEK